MTTRSSKQHTNGTALLEETSPASAPLTNNRMKRALTRFRLSSVLLRNSRMRRVPRIKSANALPRRNRAHSSLSPSLPATKFSRPTWCQ